MRGQILLKYVLLNSVEQQEKDKTKLKTRQEKQRIREGGPQENGKKKRKK